MNCTLLVSCTGPRDITQLTVDDMENQQLMTWNYAFISYIRDQSSENQSPNSIPGLSERRILFLPVLTQFCITQILPKSFLESSLIPLKGFLLCKQLVGGMDYIIKLKKMSIMYCLQCFNTRYQKQTYWVPRVNMLGARNTHAGYQK